MDKLELIRSNDLIYEMPVGAAVVKGGNELRFEVVNDEFLRAEGYTAAETLKSGRPYTDYIYPEDVGFFEDAIENCRNKKSLEELELRIVAKDGKIRWNLVRCRLYCYRDAVPYYVLTSWDIDERKGLEEELRLMDEQYRMLEEVTEEFPFEYDVKMEWIGNSYDVSSDRNIQEQLSEEIRLDPLTRVLNKVAAGEAVNRFLKLNPLGTHVLFLIDIDNFKHINDTFGHTVGDTVISDAAQVIKNQFRNTDIVARVGGDEFLTLMKNTTLEHAEEKARQLCHEAEKRLIGDDAIVNVTLSIGLAVYGTDGGDYETLFEMADRAMYHAKGNGKNNFSFARKGEQFGVSRREKQIETGAGRQEADKEFLNFAFSLLSHARDINGSLNVLIEQIGKKYGLDIVSIFEFSEDKPEMTLMNYWSKCGPVYEKNVLPRRIKEFEQAKPGQFVAVEEESLQKNGQSFYENWTGDTERIRHLAGIKFEFSGNRTGCMFVGVRQKEGGFSRAEESTFGELSRVVGVFVSLRNKLSADQKEIKHLQERDMLTGLYNMETFREKCRGLFGREETRGEEAKRDIYAFVHIDVNNFSYVNENFGQQVGDNILREFAKLILQEEHVVRACRMYSDYFVELVRGSSEEEIYQKVVAESREFEAQQKIRYPASTMRLSEGICFIRDRKDTFETILEGANLARKQAKEQKKGGVMVYREEMRKKRDAENHVTGRFYGALQKGELEVFLQPKFLLDEQTIYGAEALARWRTGSGEVVSPAKLFRPLRKWVIS